MSSMREIRERIESIQDTMKITNAMYLISSSKLKKARKDLENSQPYFDKLLYAMRSILSRAPEKIDMRYFDKREEIAPEDRKVGYIVITADRGLCGAYNHNVIKLTEEKIAGENQNHVTLFIMGQVGRAYFQQKAHAGVLDVDTEFLYTTQNPTIYRARDIADQMLGTFDKKQLDDVYIIYTKMINSLQMEPKVLQLLPLNAEHYVQTEGEITRHREAEFYPSPNAVMEHLTPNSMKGTIYGAMVESFCSEQQARMTAMESATDSAKEMLDALSLQYNRARQAAITQEITEVVAGAGLSS